MSEMTETIEDVRRRLEDGVLWITLNRPDTGNAMTVSMRNEIMDWLGDASGDPAIRASIRAQLATWHVRTVVVGPMANQDAEVVLLTWDPQHTFVVATDA